MIKGDLDRDEKASLSFFLSPKTKILVSISLSITNNIINNNNKLYKKKLKKKLIKKN